MFRYVLGGVLLLGLAGGAQAQGHTAVELDNAFVQKYHNRATMDVRYRVIGAQTKAHGADKDGEVHISGTALDADTNLDLGFATVAEIMDAKKYEGTGKLLKWIEQQGNTGTLIQMQGVWRFWGEHGAGEFKQGTFPPPESWSPRTNPSHIFELHPLTSLKRDGQTVDLRGDFKPLPGFHALTAVQRTRGAFGYYERIDCVITPGAQRTSVLSKAHQYNFLGFTAKLTSAPEATGNGDGMVATADIFDQQGGGLPGGQPLAKNVRLVFVKGTPPATAVQGASIGQQFKLAGFARISLATVKRVIDSGQQFRGNLPYEMIISSLGL